jgi:hypothetical protein
MAVLERELHMQKGKVIEKQITFNHGAITIQKVPHLARENQGMTDYYLPGSVSLKISAIAEYMEDNCLSCFNYADLRDFPEIEENYL